MTNTIDTKVINFRSCIAPRMRKRMFHWELAITAVKTRWGSMALLMHLVKLPFSLCSRTIPALGVMARETENFFFSVAGLLLSFFFSPRH